jgi:hypothetical protein
VKLYFTEKVTVYFYHTSHKALTEVPSKDLNSRAAFRNRDEEKKGSFTCGFCLMKESNTVGNE